MGIATISGYFQALLHAILSGLVGDVCMCTKNVQAIQSWTGLANYYSKFIKGLSEIMQPLYELANSDEPYHWDERSQEAFEKIKEVLTSYPVLHPDGNKDLVLHSDACGTALGATLEQRDRVIGYAEHKVQGSSRP